MDRGETVAGAGYDADANDLILLVHFPLMAYAVSQLAAMLIRSPAVAIAASLGLTMLAGFWIMLMAVGDVPLAWSVWPLPVMLLFATWWCVPDWIEERRGRRFVLRLGRESGHPRPVVAGRRSPALRVSDPGSRSGILGRRVYTAVDCCRAADPRSVQPGVEEVLGERTSVRRSLCRSVRSSADGATQSPRRT